jgi:hypothetical protein
MIEQRHLQRVVADVDTATTLLSSARRHVESARLTVNNDPEAAYALAYDASRKSATALLAYQGIRPTTAGEYPDPKSYDPITVTEATEAIEVAASCVSSAERLLQLDELGLF